MGLTVNDLPWEVVQLGEWLKTGKPELGWKGDPRLSLHLGVIRAARAGFDENAKRTVRAGEPIAFRYEVWRNCEDGVDRRIGSWHIDDWHTILDDLVKMDPRNPGHMDAVEQIHKHNEALERDNQRKFEDAYGEAISHAWDIWHDTNNPKKTFRQVGGSGENVSRNITPEPPAVD